MSDRNSLGVRIARGAALNYMGFFAGKLIVFANTVVLARLLAPEHFGLVAIGLLALAVSETIAEAGTGAAVVWHKGDVETTAPVAMAIGLLGAGLMTGLALVFAPQVAQFFGNPRVTPIVRVLALTALLSTPASVFAGILQKRMAFGLRLVPEMSKALVKGAVGIPLAWLGMGEWSLVYGQLAGVGVGMALSWWLSGWRFRLSLDRAVVADVLPYGLHIAAVGLLGLAIRRLDVAIIGSQLNPTELGYYTMAFSLVELSVIGLCWSASQAFFPALSRNQAVAGDLVAIFSRGLAALMAITVPVAVGLALVAGPLVDVLYGPKWAAAVIPMQVLCLYALVFATGFNLGDVYKAKGRPRTLIWINMANLIVAVPVLILGSSRGLLGVALGQVFVAAFISALNWWVAARASGLSFRILAAALRGPLTGALGMGIACISVGLLMPPHLASSIRLGTLIAVGATVYILLLLWIAPETLTYLRRKEKP